MKPNSLITFLLLVLCMGCYGPKRKAPVDKLRVVATTGMLYDAVHFIAGDSVFAECLMGPGVDPHLYKATQSDMRKIEQADLLIYNGLYLEGKMGDVLSKQSFSKDKKGVLAACEVLPKTLLRAHPTYANAYDPHLWFDVALWKKVVEAVSASLQENDKRHKAYYAERTQVYLDSLSALHDWIKASVRRIPETQRLLVTAHDAFGYFGERYGIEVKGLQGISTQGDVGLRDVSNLVDLLVERNVRAVFVETSVSDRALRAVIEGCLAKGHPVHIGGRLYSDAMGAFGTKEGTYIGMVKANVRTITQSLQAAQKEK